MPIPEPGSEPERVQHIDFEPANRRAQVHATGFRRIEIAPVHLAGVPVHPVTVPQALDFIADTVDARQRAIILPASADTLDAARRDAALMALLHSASLVLCDGRAIQWASRWLHAPLPEAFTSADWIDDLGAQCAERCHRLFLLGGPDGAARRAAARLRRWHPALEVRSHHGRVEVNEPSDRGALAKIRAFRPHVLLVGFGMPLQAEWLAAHAAELPVHVLIGVGVMLERFAGTGRRFLGWQMGGRKP